MRGKAAAAAAASSATRITPAYAGKSRSTSRSKTTKRDHPRLCGEKPETRASPETHAGSPPPMRGKVNFVQSQAEADRITPAYAGKRSSRRSAMHRKRDHPRLCGEKSACQSAGTGKTGSPPPMRGKVVLSAAFAAGVGITPAYAGKRLHRRSIHVSWQDHPRLCGEKPETSASPETHAGSPPPMRGKELNFQPTCPRGRITPAYAGKSISPVGSVLTQKDHPRLCGEKRTCLWLKNLPPGSPPPMRGKELAHAAAKIPKGITPAYAGKSSLQVTMQQSC